MNIVVVLSYHEKINVINEWYRQNVGKLEIKTKIYNRSNVFFLLGLIDNNF